jgi:sterol 3beta-glucosyltransferase
MSGGNTQTPFPARGTDPDPAPHIHPNTEALLNAAAKHVFPEQPAPAVDDKDVTRESQNTKKGDGRGEDQRPLMYGTPLDEMQTPMFERSAPSFRRGMGGRRETSETVRGVGTVHEDDEDLDEDSEDEEAMREEIMNGGRSQRPAGPQRFGSVSASVNSQYLPVVGLAICLTS